MSQIIYCSAERGRGEGSREMPVSLCAGPWQLPGRSHSLRGGFPVGTRRPPAREDTDQDKEVRGLAVGNQDPPQSGWVWGCLHSPGFLRGLQAVGHLEDGRRTNDQGTEGGG